MTSIIIIQANDATFMVSYQSKGATFATLAEAEAHALSLQASSPSVPKPKIIRRLK